MLRFSSAVLNQSEILENKAKDLLYLCAVWLAIAAVLNAALNTSERPPGSGRTMRVCAHLVHPRRTFFSYEIEVRLWNTGVRSERCTLVGTGAFGAHAPVRPFLVQIRSIRLLKFDRSPKTTTFITILNCLQDQNRHFDWPI